MHGTISRVTAGVRLLCVYDLIIQKGTAISLIQAFKVPVSYRNYVVIDFRCHKNIAQCVVHCCACRVRVIYIQICNLTIGCG